MKTILIIDDDHMMLNALTTLLEAENYATITSPDGETGISIYREQRPDLVLLDLRLPVKNGIEVLKEIKALNARANVIIITGYPSQEVKDESLANGAFYFYEKTKDVSELLEAIERALVPKST